MSLRRKLIILVFITLALAIGFVYIVSRAILLDGYRQLEEDAIQQDLTRALNVINTRIDTIATGAFDYARWDEAYAFANSDNPRFADEYLQPIVYEDFGIDTMLVLNAEQTAIFQAQLQDGTLVDVEDDLLAFFTQEAIIARHDDPASRVSGLIDTPQGIAIIASMPILTNDGSGPVAGTFIWANILEARTINALAEATQLNLTLTPTTETIQRQRDTINASAPLISITGDTIGTIQVSAPRDIYQQGLNSLAILILTLTVIGFILTLLGGYVMERLVIMPLRQLNEVLFKVRQGDGLSQRVTITQNDEIGQLATNMNATFAALEKAENAHTETEEQLRQAKEAAEAANAAKAVFLANMSHELRTPLNAIIGFVSLMMMKDELNDKDYYRSERVRTNAENLLQIIDDLLAISRIEAGRMELIAEDVALKTTVDTLLDEKYQAEAQEKEIALSVNIPDVTLHIDPDALHKIVENLISNAIKFTDQGGTIDINATTEADNVIIEVKDTGIGIPPHLHAVIFESFRMGDDSSTRSYGGTGLGLALVHQLCQSIGGSIKLQSTVGEGSTFIVTLPVLKQAT
jgi:signal transduction histidine kinase